MRVVITGAAKDGSQQSVTGQLAVTSPTVGRATGSDDDGTGGWGWLAALGAAALVIAGGAMWWWRLRPGAGDLHPVD